MEYQNYKKGLCDKCDGWVQFDKINDYYYCVDCHQIWTEDTWNRLVKQDKRLDYDNEHNDKETLGYLNNFGRKRI